MGNLRVTLALAMLTPTDHAQKPG